MASDEEGEFFAVGVGTFVHDPSKKFCLTKYHAKLAHYQQGLDLGGGYA